VGLKKEKMGWSKGRKGFGQENSRERKGNSGVERETGRREPGQKQEGSYLQK